MKESDVTRMSIAVALTALIVGLIGVGVDEIWLVQGSLVVGGIAFGSPVVYRIVEEIEAEILGKLWFN